MISEQQTSQNMLKCGIYFAYNYLYIYSALILYTNCIHNSYTFCRLELMYTKCIPHFGKLLYIFCIQSLAATVLLTLYTTRIQTLVNMWDTCYIHFVYISCMHLVQFLYTKCIDNFCMEQ